MDFQQPVVPTASILPVVPAMGLAQSVAPESVWVRSVGAPNVLRRLLSQPPVLTLQPVQMLGVLVLAVKWTLGSALASDKVVTLLMVDSSEQTLAQGQLLAQLPAPHAQGVRRNQWCCRTC